MVRCPGAWKNFDELEECLSLPELEKILESARKIEYESRKFAAAMKGIDLDENSDSDRFDAIKDRVDEQLTGMSKDEREFRDLGIEVETID